MMAPLKSSCTTPVLEAVALRLIPLPAVTLAWVSARFASLPLPPETGTQGESCRVADSPQDIRDLYNFVCTNYTDGDAIILIGFSRGAFTARSVGDMIASLGLLTPDGLDEFYPIFDDYQHMGDKDRKASQFLFHDLQPYQGEHGASRIVWEEGRKRKYREWLRQVGLFPATRDRTNTDRLPSRWVTPATRCQMARPQSRSRH